MRIEGYIPDVCGSDAVMRVMAPKIITMLALGDVGGFVVVDESEVGPAMDFGSCDDVFHASHAIGHCRVRIWPVDMRVRIFSGAPYRCKITGQFGWEVKP